MAERNNTNSKVGGGFVPISLLVISLVLGGYVVWAQPFDVGPLYLWGAILAVSAAGVLYVIWGFNKIRKESGIGAAVRWLFTDLTETNSSSDSAPPKMPPAPEPLENEIKFDRAGGRCEYCRERTDSLEINHITPRSEGGSNTRRNLIALCPTCLRKVDRGVYSQSELQHRVREREISQ